MSNPFTKFTQMSKRKRYALVTLVMLCIIVAYVLFARFSTQRLGEAYASYAAVARTQQEAVYLPAAPNNPAREQLNLALSDALQKTVSSANRLVDAKRGIGLLAQLDAEVDVIGSTSDTVNAMLAKLQTTYLSDPATAGDVESLISLAKQRSDIIEDIRGLSYRADFTTRTVFQRLITDKGVLTAAHITALNNELPDIETQFDRRTDLYTKLGSVTASIDRTATALWPTISLIQISE